MKRHRSVSEIGLSFADHDRSNLVVSKVEYRPYMSGNDGSCFNMHSKGRRQHSMCRLRRLRSLTTCRRTSRRPHVQVHDRSTWDCARGHTRATVVITGHGARLCIQSIHSLRRARSPAAGGAGRPTLRAVEVSSARTDLGMFVTDVMGSLGRLRGGFGWVVSGLGVVEGHTRVGRRTGYAPWGLLWSPKRANRA